jgi:hypothetical protein
MSASPEPTSPPASPAWWIPTPQNRTERCAVLTTFGIRPHRFRKSGVGVACKECDRTRSFVAHDEDLQSGTRLSPRRRPAGRDEEEPLSERLARANSALQHFVDSEQGPGAWSRALLVDPDRAAAIVARVASVATQLEIQAIRLAREVRVPAPELRAS